MDCYDVLSQGVDRFRRWGLEAPIATRVAQTRKTGHTVNGTATDAIDAEIASLTAGIDAEYEALCASDLALV